MLRPPSSARFYWFAARVQEGKVFFLYAAEPTQVFTQQSSQSPATALLAFKCGGGMFLFILILWDSTLCKQCIRFICGFYRFCYDSNKTTTTWRITFTHIGLFGSQTKCHGFSNPQWPLQILEKRNTRSKQLNVDCYFHSRLRMKNKFWVSVVLAHLTSLSLSPFACQVLSS